MSKYSNFSSAVGNLAATQKEQHSKSKEWRDNLTKQDSKTKRMIGKYVKDTPLGEGSAGKEKVKRTQSAPKRSQSAPLNRGGNGGSGDGAAADIDQSTTTATTAASTMRSASSRSMGHHSKMHHEGGSQEFGDESISTFRTHGGSEINISEDVACEIDVDTAYKNSLNKREKNKHRKIGSKPKEGNNTKDGLFWMKDDTQMDISSYKDMKKHVPEIPSFLARPEPIDKDKYMTSLNIHS